MGGGTTTPPPLHTLRLRALAQPQTLTTSFKVKHIALAQARNTSHLEPVASPSHSVYPHRIVGRDNQVKFA